MSLDSFTRINNTGKLPLYGPIEVLFVLMPVAFDVDMEFVFYMMYTTEVIQRKLMAFST